MIYYFNSPLKFYSQRLEKKKVQKSNLDIFMGIELSYR